MDYLLASGNKFYRRQNRCENDRERLLDILEAIEKIEPCLPPGRCWKAGEKIIWVRAGGPGGGGLPDSDHLGGSSGAA